MSLQSVLKGMRLVTRPHGGPHVQLVILDRDGIINVDSGAAITSEHEWQAVPGSLEAIARLNGAGYRVVVASNQPGLRRKMLDIEHSIRSTTECSRR